MAHDAALHARIPGPIRDRFVPTPERHLAPGPALPANTYAREHATSVRDLPHRPTRADRPRHRIGRANPRRRTDRRDHAIHGHQHPVPLRVPTYAARRALTHGPTWRRQQEPEVGRGSPEP